MNIGVHRSLSAWSGARLKAGIGPMSAVPIALAALTLRRTSGEASSENARSITLPRRPRTTSGVTGYDLIVRDRPSEDWTTASVASSTSRTSKGE